MKKRILFLLFSNGLAEECYLLTFKRINIPLLKNTKEKNIFNLYDYVLREHTKAKETLKKLFPNLKIKNTFLISNAFHICPNKEEKKRIKQNKEVKELVSIKKNKITPAGIFEGSLSKWNMKKINADKVWKEYGRDCGKGLVFGIADTGVDYNHPLLQESYLCKGKKHDYCWFDSVKKNITKSKKNSSCGYSTNVPCDDHGHGTHVASIAVGGKGYGISPGSKWIACRNMDRGIGSFEQYLKCLDFFFAPHDRNGNFPKYERRPHVICNSYHCSKREGCSPNALENAVNMLKQAGIIVVVAAGNSGPSSKTISTTPSNDISAISVGATDKNDNVASFSSRGPILYNKKEYIKPDICAPGVEIAGASLGGSIKTMKGTSMAAPHVCGAILLLCSLCPFLKGDTDTIKAILQSTAVPVSNIDQITPNNNSGYGRIDVYEAILMCKRYFNKTSNYLKEQTKQGDGSNTNNN